MAFTPDLTPLEVEQAVPGLSGTTAISAGGQGAVFRATHATYGDCAVKVYVSWARQRVDAEVAFLSGVNHPSVVSVHEYGLARIRGAECPLVVMDYVQGDSLRSVLNNSGRLAEDQVKRLLRDGCDVLSLLDGARKVHRDIKPENILMRPDGGFTFLDFGITRHLDLATMTAGQMPGTPGYESPEQSAGVRTLTVKCDVFALGVTSFEMLTAVHPFGRRQDAIDSGTLPLDAEPLCGCSKTLSVLLGEMMRFRPVLRPFPEDIVRELGG